MTCFSFFESFRILFLSSGSRNFKIIVLSWVCLNSVMNFPLELLCFSMLWRFLVSFLQELALIHFLWSFYLKLLSFSTCLLLQSLFFPHFCLPAPILPRPPIFWILYFNSFGASFIKGFVSGFSFQEFFLISIFFYLFERIQSRFSPFVFFCFCIILWVLSVRAEAFSDVWSCELFIVKSEAPPGSLGRLVNREGLSE